MDRELVLAVLAALLGGVTLTLAGWWPAGAPDLSGGRAAERKAWRRLWLPFVPALFTLAALAGWALNEPADAERVPNLLIWGALPFTVVFLRAAWRALRSLQTRTTGLPAATVGLLRPRVLVSQRIVQALDPAALAAALEHERAHAHHRDPLRLWLAQIGTDLLWPWPAAGHRQQRWKEALEFARDDEARLGGVAGADLAAAIVAALRLTQSAALPGVATLGADEAFLKRRVARLLQPLGAQAQQRQGSTIWMLLPALGIGLALLAGTTFGEPLVRTLFAVA
jgi:Zn-dependent protease with chaperone function